MKSILVICCIFLTSASLNALNPSRTYKQRPERYNMAYQEHRVKTNDGQAELAVWSFKAKNSNSSKVILISHNGEGNMADYLRRVDAFTSLGYLVVMFDYRGFGESSEFEIDNNMFIYPHFTDDYESMIDFCRKNYNATFDIYGWGIGAGLALGIGYQRPEVKHIIADTPFLGLEDLENRFAEWDEPLEVPFAGYEKRFEPIYTIQASPGKALISVKLIVGSNDILMSVEDLATLTKGRLINKDILVIKNPDRKDNFRVNRSSYMAAIKSTLDGK